MAIENEAREKALGVLTTEQREKLGDLPSSPMAMMQMCESMMGKMGGRESQPEGADDKND